jgi:tetratricopeptide (TPR) repeat protein
LSAEQVAEADKVIELCNAVLMINEDHTVALFVLGLALAQEHRWRDALDVQTRALQIEPNHLNGLRHAYRYALLAGGVRRAVALYRMTARIFPYEGTLRASAIEANLECGHPDTAKALIEGSYITGAERDDFDRRIADALRDYAKAHDLMAEARIALLDGEYSDAARTLERARECYSRDTVVQMNLGFAYQLAGEYGRAADTLVEVMSRLEEDYLTFAYANAAFSLARAGRLDEAMTMFESAAAVYAGEMSSWMSSGSGLPPLPSISIWADDGAVLDQASYDDASSAVAATVEAAGGRDALSPNAALLAALYREAANVP